MFIIQGKSPIWSVYTWGYVTTLHDRGGVLGRHLDTFFWALTILRSRLLACVWSGPKACMVAYFLHSYLSTTKLAGFRCLFWGARGFVTKVNTWQRGWDIEGEMVWIAGGYKWSGLRDMRLQIGGGSWNIAFLYQNKENIKCQINMWKWVEHY